MKFLFTILFSILFVVEKSIAAKSYPVTALLNAKWNVTPPHLEISEFLHDECSHLYWDYVNALNTLPVPLHELDTDFKVYTAAISAAEQLIEPIQLPILKLTLSTRVMTPRIQAHFQIAHEAMEHGDCGHDVFVTVGNRVACTTDDLRRYIDEAVTRKQNLEEHGEVVEQEEENDVYNSDHVYTHSENNEITCILYGEIGSKDFKELHEVLAQEASNGVVKYVSRHFIRDVETKPARLSGYGVELRFKYDQYSNREVSPPADDYIPTEEELLPEPDIGNFDFEKLKQEHPRLSKSIDLMQSSLLEPTEYHTVELNETECHDLSMQAAERIAQIQGEDALQMLQLTAQNFYVQAKSLLHVPISETFEKEIRHNTDVLHKELNYQPGGWNATLYVNGLRFDAESAELGTLVHTLQSEMRDSNALGKINIKGQLATELQNLDLTEPEKVEFALDIRDSAIIWLNNIEKDQKFNDLPSAAQELLKAPHPNRLPSVRKHLFNVVIVIDPIKASSRHIVKVVKTFVQGHLPIRFGVVFDTRQSDAAHLYRALNCAWNYMKLINKQKSPLHFLHDLLQTPEDDEDLTYKMIKRQFRIDNRDLSEEKVAEILGDESDYDHGRFTANKFAERLGFKKAPQVLFNGVPMEEAQFKTAKKFEDEITGTVRHKTKFLQAAVIKGKLHDNIKGVDYVMSRANLMPRLNYRIMHSQPLYLDLAGNAHPRETFENVDHFSQLSVHDITATLVAGINYFTTKNSTEATLGGRISFLTLWIITDLSKSQGVELLKNALAHLKKASSVRVAFLPNGDDEKAGHSNLNLLVYAAMNSLSRPDAINTVLKWLNQKPSEREIPPRVAAHFTQSLAEMKSIRFFTEHILALKPSQSAVVKNGKILGPLDESEVFSVGDFALIDRLHNFFHGGKIRPTLRKFEKQPVAARLTEDPDLIMKIIGVLALRQTNLRRYIIPSGIRDQHSVIKLPPKQKGIPYINVAAILDPASEGAQKLASLLILIRKVSNCDMRVILSVVEKHTEEPLWNFYRYVVEPELQFEPNGELSPGPYAKFSGVPVNQLVTQILHVPENWHAQIVRCGYDLDNIKLDEIKGPVHSEYEMEYLVLEGYCHDVYDASNPYGLQLKLGTKHHDHMIDTTIMADKGYFQFKITPGAWVLKLHHGKSDQLYNISSCHGINTIYIPDGIRIIVNSFGDHQIELGVIPEHDKAKEDIVFNDREYNKTAPILVETVNIFSIASGHLYERLLRVMIVSVMKYAKSPIKFWFLKNYLSPQFIDFIPHMADEYGFQYEYIQYKWPRWLKKQTIKMQTIWASKILFLDAIFPVDLKKVIFIDADAVVRADVTELVHEHLFGGAWGFVPYCKAILEQTMEPYRYWRRGYWKERLIKRDFHTAALFVVDFMVYRDHSCGNILREHYQKLGPDSKHIRCLDQDLPNDMVHQLAIKSLPSEWLWCETWCGNAHFNQAKVIDLCSNPKTKEPKLAAAKRIIPEWTTYDNEIHNLKLRVEGRLHEEL